MVETDSAQLTPNGEVPAEWGELVEAAEYHAEAISSDSKAPADDHTLLNAVEQLDNETLEINRFYALSLASCGIARRLAVPGICDSLTESVASSIVLWGGMTGHRAVPSLLLSDIHVPPTDKMVRSICNGAFYDLSVPVRLLADALAASSRARSSSADPKLTLLEGVMNDQLTVYSLKRTMYLGASASAKTTLRNLYAHNNGLDSSCICDDTVSVFDDILTHDEIRELKLINGARMASIRNDETVNLEDYLVIDNQGMTHFARSRVPDEPPSLSPDQDTGLIHEGRLMCPGLFVPGLIPRVMRTMPGILIRADEKLRAQAA